MASLSPAELQEAAGDFLFAGKTSVAWFDFGEHPVSADELRAALRTVTGADPFAAGLRPALDGTPRLIEAQEWRDNKIVLTFAVRGNERLVMRGFQLEEISEDLSFQAVFRLDDAILEIRSARLYVQRLREFVSELAASLGRTAASLPVSAPEFQALLQALDARLVDYTGLDNGPSPYRTRSVTKKQTCPDLASETAFQEDYGWLDAVRGDITFEGPEGDEVSALVALRTSSVYFRSAASEATIDMVYRALRECWRP